MVADAHDQLEELQSKSEPKRTRTHCDGSQPKKSSVEMSKKSDMMCNLETNSVLTMTARAQPDRPSTHANWFGDGG